MNAKQKAKELVDRFINATEYNGYGQQCALVAVDEILNALPFDYEFTEKMIDYWQQVKHEIEQL